jgi:serine/threonine-protein kinase
VDRYEVVHLLGAGGMGEVYVARDPKLGRTVALKILRADTTQGTDGSARMSREARAAAALSHANVLTVFDVGEVHEPEALRGLPYLAMELITGRTLRAYVGDEGVPLDRRIGWLRDVASALAAAHRAGVVHRDVKPENVMIRAEDGAVKVLDFGIARFRPTWAGAASSTEGHSLPTGASPAAGSSAEASSIAGTPFYMAPEQLRGEIVDGRADQFAWGVTAYALLTGKAPWKGDTDAVAILSQILSADPPPPASLDPRIPRAVSDAVMRALAKSRDARFGAMEDLVHALAAPAPRARAVTTRVAAALAGVAVLALAASVVRARRVPIAAPLAAASASAAAAPEPAAALVERRLLMNGDEVSAATLSRDGETVAYLARSERDVERLYTQPATGGARTEVAPVPGAQGWGDVVGFLDDGSLLLRMKGPDDDLAIWQVSPSGGAAHVVGRLSDHARSATLSPDGKLVAVVGAEALSVQPLSGGAASEIVRKPVYALAWSPSSDRIAYGSYDPNDEWTASVDVVSVDGKRSVHVDASRELENTGGGMALAWPEAHELLEVRRRNGGGLLVAQQLDDQGAAVGPPRTRHAWPDTEVATLSVSTVRGSIAFVKQTLRSSILVAPLTADGAHLRAPPASFAPDERSSVFLGWLGDDRVLFRSRRDGAQSLYALPLAAGPATMLLRGVSQASALASGDIVVWSNADADAGEPCALLHLVGTETRPLFTSAAADPSIVTCGSDLRCVSTPSGRRCVVGELQGGVTVWSGVDLDTGRKGKVLFKANQAPHGLGTHDFDLSPDGRSLAYTIDLTEGVGFVDLQTGEVRQPRMTPAFFPQFVRFAPGGRRVLLTGLAAPAENSTCLVAFADLSGHAHVEAMRPEWVAKPAFSPDGSHVAMNARIHEHRLWALEPPSANEGRSAP